MPSSPFLRLLTSHTMFFFQYELCKSLGTHLPHPNYRNNTTRFQSTEYHLHYDTNRPQPTQKVAARQRGLGCRFGDAPYSLGRSSASKCCKISIRIGGLIKFSHRTLPGLESFCRIVRTSNDLYNLTDQELTQDQLGRNI
jgi:hypothetical protein